VFEGLNCKTNCLGEPDRVNVAEELVRDRSGER